MRWKKKVLQTTKRKYTFEHSIVDCGKVEEATVVVFKKMIIFIEKDGEMVKYPTQTIRTSGFLKSGVVFSEGRSRVLQHMSHPHNPILKLTPSKCLYRVVATDRAQFCIRYRDRAANAAYVEVFRGLFPEMSRVFVRQVPEAVCGAIVKGNRLVFTTLEGVYQGTLTNKNKEGPSSQGVLPGSVIVPPGALAAENSPQAKKHLYLARETFHRVDGESLSSAVALSTNHGLLLLLNGAEVVCGTGKVFSLKDLPKTQPNPYQQITLTGLRQVGDVSRGYKTKSISNFFDYGTPGARAFAYFLPWRTRARILQARAREGTAEEALFVREIDRLTEKEVLRVAEELEKYIQSIKRPSTLKSPIFLAMFERLQTLSPRHAYLFFMLAPLADPKKVFPYELLFYNQALLYTSKNPGYAVVRADLQEKEKKKEDGSLLQIVHTLEDTEYIREVPLRMKNVSVIEECKGLLSGQLVGDFVFDEYDTENRRKKAFVFFMLASVGRGVFLFRRNLQASIFQVPKLKVFMKKNNNVVALTALSDCDNIWPSFHSAVAAALTVPNRPFISTMHLERMTQKSLMCLGGSIFGLGLKESFSANALSLNEKRTLTRTLLLSLSRCSDNLLIGATVLGNAFILRGTGDKNLASIISYNLKAKESGSVLLMWSVFALGVLYMGKNDLFAKQTLISYMERKGVISQQTATPEELAKTLYYDRYHALAAAFSLAYICSGCAMREYLRLPNRTCEIIANGLSHVGTRQEKIAGLIEESSPKATPVNRFYSSLFQVLIMEKDNYQETFDRAQAMNFSLESAYDVAGCIFGHGILRIPTEKGSDDHEEFVAAITLLLYSLERRSDVPSVVLDYTLLASCLALNSTGDLRILGACKRLLLRGRSIEHLQATTDYSPFAGEYREQYGLRYGRLQHIKMCLSLLVPGCGTMRICKSPHSIALLVSSFYVEHPITPEDQDAFQVLRHFYLLSLEPCEETEDEAQGVALSQRLLKALKDSPPEDVKVALDIIGSYFENNPSHAFGPNVLEYAIERMYNAIM
ncbi:hypothetical protein NEDG_00147 [Nematocida displodere]|uniref:Anaphase-promoting complex subunit 1 n=1 Tax=Nematocida displodere TaxID=1805483 RepID=A0A177EKM6_9MICR|nr:hypothetical protein NEDG_00147 [Nematocida displodere]